MKRRILKKAASLALTLALLLSLLPAVTISGAVIEVPCDDPDKLFVVSSSSLGQSFTANTSGVLSKIYLLIEGTVSGPWIDRELTIFSGDGIGGATLGTKTGLILSDSITETDWKEIDVSSLNISVTSGSMYTFYFNNTICSMYFDGSASSIYSGGQAYQDGVGYSDFDAYFKVIIDPPAPVPTVTGISPDIGPTTGGTSVTITGTNFTGATGVSFGGTSAASYIVDSATQITATTPAHAAGAVNVTVTTAGGTGTGAGLFTYASNTVPTAGFGQAMSFNGSSLAEIPHNDSYDITNSFTIEFWLKVSDLTKSQYLVSRNGKDNAANQWAAHYSNAGKVQFYTSTGTSYSPGSQASLPTIPLTDTSWHHIAFTYDGSTFSAYKDDVLTGSYPVTFSLPATDDNIYIGGTRNGSGALSNFAYSTLDEVRIWNTCRTQAQLLESMYRGAAASAAGLILYCGFNEGSGQTVAESVKEASGNVLNAVGTSTDGIWVDSVTQTFTTAEDTAVSGYLIGSDVDGDALTYSIVTNGAHGTASVSSGNQFTYMPAANFSGSDSFTYKVTDAHGTESAAQTVSIMVTPVNDAPTLTATAQNPTFVENGSPVSLFSGTTVSTIEDGQSITALTITVGNLSDGASEVLKVDGTDIALTNEASGTTTGNAVSYSVSVSGGTATVTVSKSSGITAALMQTIINAITYQNTSETPAAGNRVVTLTSLRDSEGTANGGNDTASLSISSTVTVTPVNDAPTLSGGPFSLLGTNEDTTSAGTSVSTILAGLTAADADGNILGIAITAAAGNGTWQYSTDTITWNGVGSVSGTAALLLSNGTQIRYVPDGANGETATLAFRTWDGASGSSSTNAIRSLADTSTNGGNTAFSTGTAQASLIVTAVNDAPVNAVPSAQSVVQPGPLVFSGENSNQISVSDLDAGAGAVRVTLTTTNGTLALNVTTGLTFLVGEGTGDMTMTFEGTLSDINEALNGLSFQPAANYYGPASVQIVTNDLGLSGGGGAQIDTDTVSVTVRLPVPTVSSVTSSSADRTYKAGDTVPIQVAFSQNVTVTGTPVLTLNSGGTAAYASGSGTTVLTFSYAVGSGQSASDLDYPSTEALTLSGGTIRSVDGTTADLTLPAPGAAGSLGTNKNLVIDGIAPTITSVAVPANGMYTVGQNLDFTVHYSENVTVDSSGGVPRIPATLDTGGTVYATYFSGSGTGALLFRLTVSSGQLDENGISIGAAIDLNGGTIRDEADNDAGMTLGSVGSTASILVDAVIPTLTGAVRTDDTHITVTLSEPCQNLVKINDGGFTVRKTGTATAYTVFATAQGADDSHVLLTVADMDSAGMAGVTVIYAPGINGTIADLAGNALASDSSGKTISAWKSVHTGGSGTSTSNGAEIIVNGQSQTAGTARTTTGSDGRRTTTVTVNTDRLESILNSQETGATVTVPITGGADAASGVLTGGMVQTMEDKDATLVIQTDSGSYTIPASEINIGAISQQLGTNVSLDDITVTVSISEPSQAMAQVVENAAQDGGFTLMIPAVDYTITCTYGGQTVTVNTFSTYVERTVAIPNGVDPEKITTGFEVDPDGTVHHVPTRVTVIDGKYYAVISSLTNSTYSVVWNPVEFADVANHWAKDAVNDMGSRMIVTGVGSGNYTPDRSMTRAEFAAIMVRALGLEPGTGESGFGDVSSAEWYCGYIKTAALYGIIKGYSDGTFGPNDAITREQAMTMIARAMALTGPDSGLTDNMSDALLSAYTDSSAISAYARDSIAACLKISIATGTSTATLSPKADITRAEVAVMVQRLLQKSGLI